MKGVFKIMKKNMFYLEFNKQLFSKSISKSILLPRQQWYCMKTYINFHENII